MSVSLFSAQELANVAAVARNPRHWTEKDDERIAKALATVSIANANAFKRTYGEKFGEAEPVSESDVLHFLPRVKPDRERAVATATLLDYNCMANDGTQDENLEYYRALTAILVAVLRTEGE